MVVLVNPPPAENRGEDHRPRVQMLLENRHPLAFRLWRHRFRHRIGHLPHALDGLGLPGAMPRPLAHHSRPIGALS
eukprot:scaffold1016_cov258-Pinguiococcus_pyrenoidosus.AAC.7